MDAQQELDSFKKLDEKQEHKEEVEIDLSQLVQDEVGPLFQDLHNNLTQMCNDFNKIINAERKVRTEAIDELTKSITILWGIVNQATLREAAFESLMIKKGMDLEELNAEIVELKDSLIKTGQWTELPTPGTKSKEEVSQ